MVAVIGTEPFSFCTNTEENYWQTFSWKKEERRKKKQIQIGWSKIIGKKTEQCILYNAMTKFFSYSNE